MLPLSLRAPDKSIGIGHKFSLHSVVNIAVLPLSLRAANKRIGIGRKFSLQSIVNIAKMSLSFIWFLPTINGS